jgi:hypothetical protein
VRRPSPIGGSSARLMEPVLSWILSQRVRTKALQKLAKTPIKQPSRPKPTSNSFAKKQLSPRPIAGSKASSSKIARSNRRERCRVASLKSGGFSHQIATGGVGVPTPPMPFEVQRWQTRTTMKKSSGASQALFGRVRRISACPAPSSAFLAAALPEQWLRVVGCSLSYLKMGGLDALRV